MNSAKLFGFLLLSTVFVGTAMAADKTTSDAASEQFGIASGQADSGAVFLAAPSYGLVVPQLDRSKRSERRVELSPFAGVCFTMRSYKVKRSERFRDDKSASTAYSTCQMGSIYNVYSAGDPTAK
jgi:hypothetical protein